MQFLISYWKNFRNLLSLLCNFTYLSLLNSFLFLSRFSFSLKSLDNYFFSWFAYKSLLSRFSVLISYNMWSSNHFLGSRFVTDRFFRVQVCQGPGFQGAHTGCGVKFGRWNIWTLKNMANGWYGKMIRRPHIITY